MTYSQSDKSFLIGQLHSCSLIARACSFHFAEFAQAQQPQALTVVLRLTETQPPFIDSGDSQTGSWTTAPESWGLVLDDNPILGPSVTTRAGPGPPAQVLIHLLDDAPVVG